MRLRAGNKFAVTAAALSLMVATPHQGLELHGGQRQACSRLPGWQGSIGRMVDLMPDLQRILREPRHDLVKAPTPLQRLSGFERALGRPGLFMKRDDLMEIGLGGNKLRSLEFWLGAALRERADIVLVAGGRPPISAASPPRRPRWQGWTA